MQFCILRFPVNNNSTITMSIDVHEKAVVKLLSKTAAFTNMENLKIRIPNTNSIPSNVICS